MKVKLSLILLTSWITVFGQSWEPNPQETSEPEERGDFRLVFYNVENLFDPFDDSLSRDEEFLPGGIRGWNWERFLEKQRKLYKVLVAAGDWKPPELIGLAEVENRFVLNWLCRETPLLKYNYRIIHRDSPDERGIDVAMLYLPDRFRVIKHRYYTTGISTREILYVKGLFSGRDTLHLFFNHWPSRWKGLLESQEERIVAAGVLQDKIDSIHSLSADADIIVTGDFNDEPGDPSMDFVSGRLHKCGGGEAGTGTLKYKGNWYDFDQVYVSSSLLDDSGPFVCPGKKIVFDPAFLFEKDPGAPGKRPFRTYTGYRYHGGFSDHLPVYLDVRLDRDRY